MYGEASLEGVDRDRGMPGALLREEGQATGFPLGLRGKRSPLSWGGACSLRGAGNSCTARQRGGEGRYKDKVARDRKAGDPRGMQP